MNKAVKYIILIIAVLLLAGAFIGGCQYHKRFFSCPVVKSDTILIHDTIPHYIIGSFPYYVQGKDSIIHDTIPRNIDTLAILHDYYDKHIYNRKWENDTLKVNLKDTISRNMPIGNIFKYQIKIPFTTINNFADNSINYSKYLYIGLDVPVKNTKFADLALLVALRRGYFGVGYSPMQGDVSLKAGLTLFKLR